ncbi:MAG: tetratricopeptide repeat protein [Bdellovibrionota bacterium]
MPFVLRLTTHFLVATFALALNVVASLPTRVEAQTTTVAVRLYEQGKVNEAEHAFAAALSAAEKGDSPNELWETLIGYAWFLDEIGEHRRAIELSNKALGIAAQSENKFMIGRSLSWLGWAYTGLGLYELALDFYRNAVDVAAPGGKIEIVNVWGLSTQEIGALHYKMGRTKEGRPYLEKALSVARELKVGPGIAEGAAHLAELSLTEGRYEEAESLAREAFSAGEKCEDGCTPYNTVHARVILAKVLFERAKLDPNRMADAQRAIRETLAAAEKAGLKRCVAESKLLLARSLPPPDFETRYALVTDAFDILATMESELRGTAESELGKLFLDNGETKLAEFYLKNGYRVNKELFRRIDNAFITSDEAVVSALNGDSQRSVKQLRKAFREAVDTKNLPAATEIAQKLSGTYLELGYATLALNTAKKGLQLLDELSQRTKDDAVLASYRARRADLSATFGEASLRVDSGAEGGAPV